MSQKKTFLVCHGAWGGGWSWKKLHPLMQAAGHRLVTPTHTRARIYDSDGRLLLDSRSLSAHGAVVRSDLPDSAERRGLFDRLIGFVRNFFDAVRHVTGVAALVQVRPWSDNSIHWVNEPAEAVGRSGRHAVRGVGRFLQVQVGVAAVRRFASSEA